MPEFVDETMPVMTKEANGLVLSDMSGNVWEWVWDWYDGGYYAVSPDANPTGASSGAYRVLCGGSWGGFAEGCRSASRINSSPDYRNFNLGFRLVRRP